MRKSHSLGRVQDGGPGPLHGVGAYVIIVGAGGGYLRNYIKSAWCIRATSLPLLLPFAGWQAANWSA